MRIVVPGHPTPAVRMTQRGKWVKSAAARYLRYKNEVSWVAKAAKQKAGLKTFTGPVEVIATAYIYGNKSGDADNLAKAFLDGMNGIVWVDDRQVTDLTIRKRKVSSKDEERAEIEIREAKQESDMVLVDRDRLVALEEIEQELLHWIQENKAK